MVRKISSVRPLMALPFLLSITSLFAAPVLHLEPAMHDFGNLEKGEQATAAFKLQNTGDQVAMIQFMDMSMQGLIAQVNPRVESGSTVKIIVNWDTTNFEGEVEGKIVLGFSDREVPDVVVNVKGNVLPAVQGASEVPE